jgi:signal transduction histidine kinase
MTHGLRWRRTRSLRGAQLIALLLIAVAVPSACVLWFMNEAVKNQSETARVSLLEAHRGQLRLVRTRLNAYWLERAAGLDANLPRTGAAAFKQLVVERAADAVVILGRDGLPVYPAPFTVREATGDASASEAARAAQDTVRELMRAGDRRAAIDAIRRQFLSGPAARGLDGDGRLIAADEHLLLITLLAPSDRRRKAAIDGLTALLNDYANATIPSTQRLFLMEQLRSMDPGLAGRFPTLEAERIAIVFLEHEQPLRARGAFRQTGVRDIWQLTSTGGRVAALYRTDTVLRAMQPLVDEQSSSTVRFVVAAPGQSSGNEALDIGSAAPGWEVSFAMTDPAALAQYAIQRRNRYFAAALLAIGTIAVAVAVFGGAARRQLRLASLRTDLVAAVSHELKTPLASMRLLVDALLDDADPDPAKTRDYLRLMAQENDRLSRLIENFLTFSRLERHRHRFEFKLINPADIVRDALQATPAGWRGDQAPVVECAPDLPPILADDAALVTVLLNLLDNAHKYTPANQRIALRVFRQGRHVVFEIEDNGIGIPAREQKRIFRRFYRVDQRLARDTSGSGLGLSIVDAIVRAHGGIVRVRSAPAHGSTFSVYLPYKLEGAAA